MVKAIVTGVSSKMGGRLVQFVYETDGIELIGAVDSKDSSAIGQDVGEYHHKGFFGVPIVEDLRDCIKHSCVVIDFGEGILPGPPQDRRRAQDIHGHRNHGVHARRDGTHPRNEEDALRPRRT